MADAELENLPAVDREMRQAATALARWRVALAHDPDAHADEDPLADFRHIAVKSTWDALRGSGSGGGDTLLREALRRWVHTLIQARLGRADEVARARAEHTPQGWLDGELPRQVSWREAWRGVISARTPDEARRWLRTAYDAGPHIADVNRRAAARRVEVARRLGHSHPWEIEVPAAAGAIRAAAARLLDATEDVSAAVSRETVGRDADAAAAVHAAMARDAGDGWPARLTPRWLETTFAGARGLPIELPALPSTLGAASFARALYSFGFAIRVAETQRSMPFALAREPAFVGAHRLGFLFGALATDPELYIRSLAVGRRKALAQARTLTWTALLDARVHSARVLLASDGAGAPLDSFDEIGTRVFGSPLHARLKDAWPAARDDEPARLVGLLGAHSLREAMRGRFDTDWFLNPRAWSHLRAEAATVAREPVDETALLPAASALGRAFEEALG